MIDLAELRRYYNNTVVAAMEGITNPVDDLAIAALDAEPMKWCRVHEDRIHPGNPKRCLVGQARVEDCDTTTIVLLEVTKYERIHRNDG